MPFNTECTLKIQVMKNTTQDLTDKKKEKKGVIKTRFPVVYQSKVSTLAGVIV